MQPQVFVSYSSRDQNDGRFADLLNGLRRRGIKTWIDKKELATGDAVAVKLHEAVQSCVACVFLQTNNSLESAWCAAELGAFWGAGKRVIILAEKDTNISKLMPPLEGIRTAASVDEVLKAVKQITERSGDDVNRLLSQVTEGEFADKLFFRLKNIIAPVTDGITKVQDRLAGLLPFEEHSVFGMRYQHFFQEKQAIARTFMADLDDRIKALRGANRSSKVRLILDAGTTIFPIFRMLMEHKNDPEWVDAIEIITNNIPGILVALRDGRTLDGDPDASMAYKVHVIGGDPTPAYWALLPADPEEELSRLLGRDSEASAPIVTIGVTTGNYARDTGRTLFVRGRQHSAFKHGLMKHSTVIYSLLPLGKMLPWGADELNASLVSENLRCDDEYRYTELEVPLEKGREVVVITTARERHNKLFKHWAEVEFRLRHLQRDAADAGASGRILTTTPSWFNVSALSFGKEEKEEELEMPHERHRPTLKRWFRWDED